MARSSPYRHAVPVSLTFTLALVFSVSAHSATWSVRKDGTGQFTTINGARAVATTGDIIEVGPGVYPEEIDFDYSVTLVSTDGAGATVLDGETVRRILVFRAGPGSVVDGFTLRRGYHISSGGALRVQVGATASARNCIFTENHADFDGGAVICRDPGSRLDISNCTFVNNTAERFAGAALIVEGGAGSFDRCTFDTNSGEANGAIATNTGANYSVTNCLFVGNSGSRSAMYAQASTLIVRGNTFYSNLGSATLGFIASTTTVERNLFVGNTDGSALSLSDVNMVSRTCNLYWDNDDNGTAGPGEIILDPLFCDALAGDFTVSIHSPAAPANSPCGQLMGAFETNCNIEPPPPPPPPV